MHSIQYYMTYLPVLIGTAGFFALALMLWLTGKRALASSRGGLDWVREYQIRGIDFSYDRLTHYDRDKLCLFAAAVCSLVLSTAVILLRSHYETGSWFAEFYKLKTMCKLLVYAAGAVSVCWLLQDLFRNDILAVCGSILFAASFVGSHTAMALLVISLLLFLRWFVVPDDAPLMPRFLLLAASNLFLAMAASRMLGLTWVALGYLTLHIYKSIRRSGARRNRTWEIIVMPIVGILLWFLGYLISSLGVLAVVGLLTPDNFTATLTPQYLLHVIQRPFRLPTMIFTEPIYRGLLIYPLTDAPLLMLGIFGFFVAVRTAIDRHEPYAVISVFLLLLLGIAWACTRQYCLLPGMILCGICLLRRFAAAEQNAPIIVYTVLGCIYYIVLYILTYLFGISPVLAQILA